MGTDSRSHHQRMAVVKHRTTDSAAAAVADGASWSLDEEP